MKKLLSLILVCALLLGLCPAAFATEAQYTSTKAFLTVMDALNIKYTVGGMDSSNNELVVISNSDSEINFTYAVAFFFNSDESHCSIRVWDIITFGDADFAKVLRTVNSLNEKYKYVKFSVDEDDNTVTASMDLIYNTEAAGQVVTEAMLRSMQIIEDSYPSLAVYSK